MDDGPRLGNMRRHLQPGFVLPVGDRLWAVDEFQPVAAVLDPGSGTVQRTVRWPQLPPPPVTNNRSDGWRILGADAGLWVQPYPAGPVALIGMDGLVRADYVAGRRLCGVTPAGAWCGPQPRNRHKLAKRPPKSEEILCLTPEGILRAVTVDRPVGQLCTAAGGIYVRVRADPTERPGSLPPMGKPDPGETWLHLPAETPLPERLTRTEHGDAEPPSKPDGFGPGSPWHSPAGIPGPDAEEAGGLRWKVGCDLERPDTFPVIATGHDRDDGSEHRRVELDSGRVLARTGWGEDLWIAIRRVRPEIPDRHAAVELLRVHAPTGQVGTVLPAESVEITEQCWPLPPKPPDADSYAEYQRRKLDTALPPTSPNSETPREGADGLRSCRAELAGSWPDTTIHLRCTHTEYPGLELVRVLGLFDELGRQHPPEYAEVHLQEAFDTGTLPAISKARHGLLYI